MSATSAPLRPPSGSTLRAIPGDPGLPVVGDSLKFLSDQLDWARARYDRYGPVSWSNVFGDTVVSAIGPEVNEAILINRDRTYSQEGWHYFIGRLFTRGLMLLDFDEHLHHRRIMQQAFTRTRLRGYVEQMAPVIRHGVAAWPTAVQFHVYPAIKQLTLNLANAAFVGVPLGERADRINRAFVDTLRAATAIVRMPVPGGRWARGLRGRKLLDAYIRGMLPAKRTSDGDDMFAALCQAESPDGDVFSDDDVVNHMIFLLMAAHDTTTITMSSMVYELARDLSWQERARAESMALNTDAPDFDELESLSTLDMVMRESLRMVAPVPQFPRKTTRDTELLGYHIPRGTTVTANPTLTHRLGEWWPDPDAFDPERFSPERQATIPKGAYVPFGGGVHKCIGLHFGRLQVVAVMHQMLRRFRWSVDPGYVMPLDTTALPAPGDGLPVRLEPLR